MIHIHYLWLLLLLSLKKEANKGCDPGIWEETQFNSAELKSEYRIAFKEENVVSSLVNLSVSAFSGWLAQFTQRNVHKHIQQKNPGPHSKISFRSVLGWDLFTMDVYF